MSFARTVIALVAALWIMPAAVVHADPIGDLVHPPHDAGALNPSPIGDPFKIAPPGFERLPAGAVINRRPVAVGPLLTPVFSTQLLVRSNDSHDRAVPVTTTVIVPQAPWTAAGPRPVVAYNTAIDSLGLDCVPSVTLVRGTEIELAAIQLLLSRNYAVIVTDHQGPRQAYGAGRMSGHAVLDATRAALHAGIGLDPKSPVGLSGYSGGAIASGWAAQLAPTYAPELNIVGAAVGGTPVDYRILLGSMNGTNLASGVFLAAAMGVGREYPELFSLLNDNGWRLGTLARDWCLPVLAATGVVAPIPAQALSDVPDVLNNPIVQHVLDDTRMGLQAPKAPVYLYQGQQDPWIPHIGAEQLYRDWCARGARVQLSTMLGEHLLPAVAGITPAFDWLAERFAGKPVPAGCFTTG